VNRQCRTSPPAPWTNLFLTGPTRAGKTTLLFRTLLATRMRVGGFAVGGFAVKRVYRYGRCVRMDMIDLASRSRGRLVTFDASGMPAVTAEVFVTVGIPAIETALRDAQVVVMDEIGRFELKVPAFLEAVETALDSPVPVVGIIKDESNPFLDKVRSRRDIRLVRVVKDRREEARREFERLLATLLSRQE